MLVAGGWSLLLLALFYWVIDVLRFRAWTFFFVVIGVNAITIYLLPHLVDFHRLVHFFFGALFERTGSAQAVLGRSSSSPWSGSCCSTFIGSGCSFGCSFGRPLLSRRRLRQPFRFFRHSSSRRRISTSYPRSTGS